MKNLILLSVVGLSVVISGKVLAEVPTKPTHSNTTNLKASKDKSSEEKELIAKEEAKDGHSRAMIKEESDDKKSNVINSIKSGRLAESNKHVTD